VHVTLASLLFPALLLAAGLAAGLVARAFLTTRLARVRDDAPGAGHLFLNVAHGSAVLWFSTLGLYLASEAADLPARISRIIGHVLLVMLIASVTWMLSRIAGGLVRSHASVGALPSATVMTNLARGLVLLVGFLVVLQTLGVSITPLITALGVGGLAVALALQDTLANLFAGLHILLSRQVQTGDFVRLDSGQEGIVQDVTWRYTSIRQPGSGLLVVPNAKLAATITTNFTRPDTKVAVKVGLSVGYDSDLDHVEREAADVAREVMRDVDGGVHDAEPVIRFQKLGVATIQFTAELTARDVASQGLVKHEFIKHLLRRFRAEGIELPGGASDEARAERVSLAVAEKQGVT
jgi:small-conductance mechanosensitive channel